MTYEELNLNNLLYKTTTNSTIIQKSETSEIPSENIQSGEMTGNLFINKGFVRSKNFISGSSGWSLDDNGTAEFVGLTLSGGTFKYGKTSFSDLVNSGYYIGSDGLNIGDATHYLIWNGTTVDATGFRYLETYTYGENITANNIVCQKPGYTDFSCNSDSWTSASQPDTNFGSDTVIRCSTTDGYIGYIGFNLSSLPVPQYIIKAELILTSLNNLATVATLFITPLDGSFSEMTITNNNAPASTSLSDKFGYADTFYYSEPGGITSISYDITQYIRQIAGSAVTFYGFSIGSNGNRIDLYSRHSAGTAPYIRVWTRDNGDGKLYKANRNDYLLCRSIVGIAQETGNINTSHPIQITGKAVGFSSLHSGTRIFLDSTVGGITQTLSNPLRQLQIGKATSSTEILLNIQDRDIAIEVPVNTNQTIAFNSTYGHTRTIYAPVDARYVQIHSTDDNNHELNLTVYRDTIGPTSKSLHWRNILIASGVYLDCKWDTDNITISLYGYSTSGSIVYTFFN